MHSHRFGRLQSDIDGGVGDLNDSLIAIPRGRRRLHVVVVVVGVIGRTWGPPYPSRDHEQTGNRAQAEANESAVVGIIMTTRRLEDGSQAGRMNQR